MNCALGTLILFYIGLPSILKSFSAIFLLDFQVTCLLFSASCRRERADRVSSVEVRVVVPDSSMGCDVLHAFKSEVFFCNFSS